MSNCLTRWHGYGGDRVEDRLSKLFAEQSLEHAPRDGQVLEYVVDADPLAGVLADESHGVRKARIGDRRHVR